MKEVQISLWAESEKAYGGLVDLIFNEQGKYTSGSRLVWFPKKICKLREEKKEGEITSYFITAPLWLLEKNNINIIK